MAKIKLIKIENFRGIKSLEWRPSPGVNCLIGNGDSSKSSILDAIEIVLNPKYWARFSDTDFYNLDVSNSITIEVSIGNLSDDLKNLNHYGDYLRGYDPVLGAIHDEPGVGLETILTQRLTVKEDLEPEWALVSDRTVGNDSAWRMRRADASAVSPLRIGASSDSHFAWRQRSILYSLDEVRPDASADLAEATRNARTLFEGKAAADLASPLKKITDTAARLNVPLAGGATAQLDAQGMKLSNGGVSVHDGNGVPLRCLGLGSSRLLIGGLFCEANPSSSIMLVDEIEHGLEPHRIIRFLKTLKSHVVDDGFQVFATTHSAVTLRELQSAELCIVHRTAQDVAVKPCGSDVQGILRSYPEAFLSPKILMCEGASEIGFVRGIDEWNFPEGSAWISAAGVSLIDAGGGGLPLMYEKASLFISLGYEVAIFRDNDLAFEQKVENVFLGKGGAVFKWREGQTLEDAIFAAVNRKSLSSLLALAEEIHGSTLVGDHISAKSEGVFTLDRVKAVLVEQDSDLAAVRAILSAASQTKKHGWFKRIDWMERATREIIVTPATWPNLPTDFTSKIQNLTNWCFGRS